MDTEIKVIDDPLVQLIRNLVSIKEADTILLSSIESIEENFILKLEEMEKNGAVEINRNEVPDYNVATLKDATLLNYYTQIMRPISKLEKLKSFIPRSLLIIMVSQWDSFFAQFVKSLFLKKKTLFSKFSGNIEYKDLSQYESMEEIKTGIIEKEVEDLMRNSHKYQIEWLGRNTDLKLIDQIDSWKMFIELTERRNICVHNDGKVSKIYLKNCNENQIIVPGNLKIGDEVSIDTVYLSNICDYLISTACKLVHTVWRKQFPSEMEQSIFNLINLSVELIGRGYYQSALDICDFGIEWRGELPEKAKLYLILNKAQALKWLNKLDDVKRILDSIEWETKSDVLLLPKLVLEDNFSDAANCMRRIGRSNEEINSIAYENFPIFKEFRKSEEFLKAYKEVFGIEFELSAKPSIYVGRLDHMGYQ
jgi:hypothetical protein